MSAQWCALLFRNPADRQTDRQLALLTTQQRQAFCLVEMESCMYQLENRAFQRRCLEIPCCLDPLESKLQCVVCILSTTLFFIFFCEAVDSIVTSWLSSKNILENQSNLSLPQTWQADNNINHLQQWQEYLGRVNQLWSNHRATPKTRIRLIDSLMQ